MHEKSGIINELSENFVLWSKFPDDTILDPSTVIVET